MNVLSFEFQNIAIKIIIIVTVCALRIWELYIVLVTVAYIGVKLSAGTRMRQIER